MERNHNGEWEMMERFLMEEQPITIRFDGGNFICELPDKDIRVFATSLETCWHKAKEAVENWYDERRKSW